ncbi:MAG: sigma-70 family RNA polymerase sigma factor [Solirubrobacterales bacterium]|nr:sigma-70 family RNA polymerase sigma factor [Solirubrobacterales bacterium]
MEARATQAAVPLPGPDRFTAEMEGHRRELTGYCYRMLGAGSEAEDAVQETFLRAWRSRDGFEGRASLRSWLYRIATNVCLDMPQRPQRRARPMDLAGPATTATAVLAEQPEHRWVQPIADGRVLGGEDPAELAAQRETIRLAFIAALQRLPARQRAVLILRDVLHWQASEVADLLGCTAASVNSALQRARATLHEPRPEVAGDEPDLDPDAAALLAQYVSAFTSYDIDRLVTLLRDDVTFSMPPHNLWLRGPLEVGRWMLGPGAACRDSRLVATRANGCPAFASYKPDGAGGHRAWSIQVLSINDDRITAIHNYLNTELFEAFGLPLALGAG